MARVVLEDICKSFGPVEAVRDVNLDIADGELLVLVGPSGCGKSTTLRMVAGLEEITSGRLIIGDREVNKVHPKDRDIAMVFQSYALYPHMTVFDNIAFGLKLRCFAKQEIRRRVYAASHTLGLQDLLDRKPKALSGGQRQRVAMGRAIVRDPAVFLFDEPLSNLDARFRVAMRLELKMLQRKLGTTTLYVTHDQTEAMTLADRIAVMEDGLIRQAGTPQEVFDSPADLFVAGFIGSPAMNFMKGEVVRHGESISVRCAGALVRPSDPQVQALSGSIGSEVTVGVRPGSLSTLSVDTDANPFSGLVEVVENLGIEKYAYVRTEDGLMTVRLPANDPVVEGAEIRFGVQPNNVHIFYMNGKSVLLEETQGEQS